MNKQELFEAIEANFNTLAEEHVGTTTFIITFYKLKPHLIQRI